MYGAVLCVMGCLREAVALSLCGCKKDAHMLLFEKLDCMLAWTGLVLRAVLSTAMSPTTGSVHTATHHTVG